MAEYVGMGAAMDGKFTFSTSDESTETKLSPRRGSSAVTVTQLSQYENAKQMRDLQQRVRPFPKPMRQTVPQISVRAVRDTEALAIIEKKVHWVKVQRNDLEANIAPHAPK